ncbi:MAG: phosphoglucosamine mutase [Bdellovibrionales bacterium RIFCSPHIGHO2_01_FULL_40_29]|nr:MAG: phosphoglucosamine mutase [Bdellovibrionales bacterium RIFCSPHIGHO2_01_FULL_40_29]OFZ34380.1 MAG: phosphoglucosamine mutase [Bdellovibrionales bacterium RIFCSPHIGHO2_02_FULL_40_15]
MAEITTQTRKLFGTDGIRGTSNQFPMIPDVVVRIGQAIGYLIRTKRISSPSLTNKVVIGKDTRLSGYMIEQALSSGLNSMGITVQLVGPLPTPGIGYLTRTMRAATGIVISASHNAYQDNGIKIFGPDGFKLDDILEQEIERLVADEDLTKLLPPAKDIGRTKRIEDAQSRYVVYAKSAFPLEHTLDGLRIVLDTAHGAAYKVAPAIFEELGAEVIHVGNQPNGTNINDKVGALHPSLLSQAVVQYRADVGIGLDGDADRVIMVDEKGKMVNGDHIIAICAIHMKQKKQLSHNTVVVTQMSNFGLEKSMKSHGINVIKTNVGDKYVVEAMRKGGFNLGGEQSGHVIFLDYSTTGDGTVAALNVLSVMRETRKKISELTNTFEEVPQVLINCRVRSRVELENIKGYSELLTKNEADLNGEGRIFIRYSGTEPLIRILVEGSSKQKISAIAEQMASFLEKEIS